MNGGPGQHDGSQRTVRATVEQDLYVLCHERSIPHDSRAVTDDTGVALRCRCKIFMSIVDQAHRSVGLAGE